MDWPNLTDDDQVRLEDAITQGDEFRKKLLIFRSGLISEKYRWLQLEAHKIYDSLSERELQVFKMRTKQHTFPQIASVLDISVSSAKTYWRRSLAKCAKGWESSV
jgi:DNA-binding CsgD family transcriptional regulator